ncbi:winged helix-turn-helix domain-containing protein [Streptomyces sp. NPDC002537]
MSFTVGTLIAAPPAPHAPVYRVRGLVVDLDRRAVSVRGRAVKLSCMEFELLAHLVTHPQQLHRHEQLMRMVWQQSTAGDTRTVDAHIARLRHKLGPHYGSAITGDGRNGYAFRPPVL